MYRKMKQFRKIISKVLRKVIRMAIGWARTALPVPVHSDISAR